MELGFVHAMIPPNQPTMNAVPDGIGRGARYHAHEDPQEAQADLPEIEAEVPAKHEGECPEEEIDNTE